MTVTAVDPRVLERINGDVRQLAEPIHMAVRGRVVTTDPLLDQLRAATVPGSARRGEVVCRVVPGSRPPAVLGAIDALGGLYLGLSQWHARLHLPAPPEVCYTCAHVTCRAIVRRQVRVVGPRCSDAGRVAVDWHKHVLHQLRGVASTLAGGVADWLAADVREWWQDAATHSGWRPADLHRLR